MADFQGTGGGYCGVSSSECKGPFGPSLGELPLPSHLNPRWVLHPATLRPVPLWVHSRNHPAPGHPRGLRVGAGRVRPAARDLPPGRDRGLPAARHLVQRFDRRGTEPNELFRSEFRQNSSKIQEFSLEILVENS